jgi:hypothetical protein
MRTVTCERCGKVHTTRASATASKFVACACGELVAFPALQSSIQPTAHPVSASPYALSAASRPPDSSADDRAAALVQQIEFDYPSVGAHAADALAGFHGNEVAARALQEALARHGTARHNAAAFAEWKLLVRALKGVLDERAFRRVERKLIRPVERRLEKDLRARRRRERLERIRAIAGVWVPRVAAAGGVLVVLGAVAWAGWTRLQQARVFDSHLEAFLAPVPASYSPSPYVRDRVVAVDRSTKKVADLHFRLSAPLKALRPGEVGTVVWVECASDSSGVYTDGAGAFVHRCEVTVVDLARHAAIAQRSFRGSNPPAVKRGAGPRYGSMPTDEMLAYVENLPRK